MGGASGPVQLAELGVSLNDTLIDGGGQAEGRVDLQEVDAGQRRAANSSDTKRGQEKSQRPGRAETLVRFPACCLPARPGVGERSSLAGRNLGQTLRHRRRPLSRYGEGTPAGFQSDEAKS